MTVAGKSVPIVANNKNSTIYCPNMDGILESTPGLKWDESTLVEAKNPVVEAVSVGQA